MDPMLDLIILINSLATELFFDKTYLDGEDLFQRGCCYELYLIINSILPETELLIHRDKDHVVIKYKNKIYDSKGLVTDIDDYGEINDLDNIYIEEFYGLHYRHLHVAENIINELYTINIEDLLNKFKNNNKKKID